MKELNCPECGGASKCNHLIQENWGEYQCESCKVLFYGRLASADGPDIVTVADQICPKCLHAVFNGWCPNCRSAYTLPAFVANTNRSLEFGHVHVFIGGKCSCGELAPSPKT